jgi:exopolysaccharide production protein ExoZ
MAAAAVAVHHFIGPAYFDLGIGQPPSIGEAGVDLFFVISGFIMWITTRRRETTPLDFMRHRIVRIIPLYWFFTLLFLAITVWVKHSPVSSLDVVRSLFFIPWYEGHLSQKTSAFYFLGWTLMYEMFFYCVFAIVLFLHPKMQFFTIVCSLSFLVTAGLLLNFKNGPSFTYTSPLLLEFVAGCLVGRLYERKMIPPSVVGTVLFGAALLAIIATSWSVPDTLLARSLMWGVPSMLILLGALSLETFVEGHQSKLLLLLGDASYSIYLSHFIAFLVFNSAVKRMDLLHTFDSKVAVYSTLGVAFSLVVGAAIYALIERPLVAAARSITMSFRRRFA